MTRPEVTGTYGMIHEQPGIRADTPSGETVVFGPMGEASELFNDEILSENGWEANIEVTIKDELTPPSKVVVVANVRLALLVSSVFFAIVNLLSEYVFHFAASTGLFTLWIVSIILYFLLPRLYTSFGGESLDEMWREHIANVYDPDVAREIADGYPIGFAV